jgi:hypothetical protein
MVKQQTSLFGQLELAVQLSVTSPMHCPFGPHDSVIPPGPPPLNVTQHSCIVGSHDCMPHDICVLPPLLLPLPPPLLLPPPLPEPEPEPLPPLPLPPSAVGPVV